MKSSEPIRASSNLVSPLSLLFMTLMTAFQALLAHFKRCSPTTRASTQHGGRYTGRTTWWAPTPPTTLELGPKG